MAIHIDADMYGHPATHETTRHGLNNWHKHMFEEMGWMVLLKAKGGYDYKITAYKKSVEHLLKSLEESIRVYTEVDRKHDLIILHKNVCVLRDFVKKHL
jgi:hypothetical protein